MGYAAEKEKLDKRYALWKRIALAVVVAVLAGFCVFGAFVPPITWKYYVGKPSVQARGDGELRVHFLDVGQGDSALAELPDGKILLVDGGDEADGTATKLMRYLNALKIRTIDYLVVSHADADHCGALDVVAKYKTVLNAYLPAVNPASAGEAYAEMYAELTAQKTALHFSARGVSFGNTEGYRLEFLYPYQTDVEETKIEENSEAADSNELSSVLFLEYRDTSVLFTGDAPEETESNLLRDAKLGMLQVSLDDVEILKVAHHGSSYSTSAAFLEYIGAEAAIVSCGEGNAYGHPHSETIARLAAVNAKIYRTDTGGTICVTIAPSGVYTVSQEKS